MALTTETAVREIIDTPLTSVQVLAAINDADLWVVEELTDNALSPARMELIERYLACALIRCTRDVDLVSANFGDVREQYQRDSKVTEYLNLAASFDPSGSVRKVFITKTTSATFKVGRRFSHPIHRR